MAEESRSEEQKAETQAWDGFAGLVNREIEILKPLIIEENLRPDWQEQYDWLEKVKNYVEQRGGDNESLAQDFFREMIVKYNALERQQTTEVALLVRMREGGEFPLEKDYSYPTQYEDDKEYYELLQSNPSFLEATYKREQACLKETEQSLSLIRSDIPRYCFTDFNPSQTK